MKVCLPASCAALKNPGRLVKRLRLTRTKSETTLRDQAFPAVEGHQLIVLASSSELQHLEQRPDGEGLFEYIRLLGKEVEPENRIFGEGEMFAEAPMIRRVAEWEAEGIGRALRLDVIDAQQCKAAAVPFNPVERGRDDVLGADGVVEIGRAHV